MRLHSSIEFHAKSGLDNAHFGSNAGVDVTGLQRDLADSPVLR
ncbi:hypothetical protein [Nocardia carnea]|nr:hypothetical protein [Nocardia carnea]